MYPRTLEPRLRTLVETFPAVFLTGPRQSGKTTLARTTFPDFEYLSLEDLQNRQEVQEDPRGFLRRLEGKRGVILDEVQRTPDLFSYLQAFLDEERGGPLVLTGSQNFLLAERISQSLAGRVAVLELLPFSVAELAGRPALLPEELAEPASRSEDKPPFPLEELLFRGPSTSGAIQRDTKWMPSSTSGPGASRSRSRLDRRWPGTSSAGSTTT